MPDQKPSLEYATPTGDYATPPRKRPKDPANHPDVLFLFFFVVIPAIAGLFLLSVLLVALMTGGR